MKYPFFQKIGCVVISLLNQLVHAGGKLNSVTIYSFRTVHYLLKGLNLLYKFGKRDKMGVHMRKSVFGSLQTTKTQTSLRTTQTDKHPYSLLGKNYI